MQTYTVRLNIEVADVEAETPEAAIAWVKGEVKSVLDFGTGGLYMHNEKAEDPND